MTLKEQIKSLFSENMTQLNLEQIYAGLPNIKRASIRGTLNLSIKKGIDFERTHKGCYQLKQ